MRLALLLLVGCTASDPKDDDTDTDTDADTDDSDTDVVAETTVTLDVEADPAVRLSAYNFMSWDGSTFSYTAGVLPYDLNTPLFSDYALKERAIYLPDGEVMGWQDEGAFDFPVGSAIIKSFLFPADFREPDADLRLVETRLLVRTADEWKAYPYLWEADGSDALLKLGGEVLDVDFIDAQGQAVTTPYVVPQKNQCTDCHELKDDDDERVTVPIGPKARNIRPEDLEAMEDLFDAPSLTTVEAAVDWSAADVSTLASWSDEQVAATARDYLDINCAHCHNERGVNGISSQLFLEYDNDDLFHLGVCKRPGSAGAGGKGRTYDIVPGDHEASILHFRMVTDVLGAMMPDIGRVLAHEEGAAVVAEWIDRMEGDCSE